MSSYQVGSAEILYLLNTAGVSRPALMTAEEFDLPEDTLPEAPQAEANLLQALAGFLAGPEVVVRVWRQEADSAARNVWYYCNGDAAVAIERLESGAFELTEVPGVDVLLNTVESSLALRPVSKAEDFFCVMDRTDFLDLRDLANVWEEVPAFGILEADGLEKSSARELFDVAAEPEWRAQVNFSGLRDEGNVERVLRVAQGAESAWMALPVDENLTQIRVEMVQAGEVAALLRAYWQDVGA